MLRREEEAGFWSLRSDPGKSTDSGTQCLVGWGRGLHSHSCEGRRTAGPQRQTSAREATASPTGLWNLVTLWSCLSRANVSRPLDPSICQLSDKGCIFLTLAEAVTPSKVNAKRDSAQGLSPWG